MDFDMDFNFALLDDDELFDKDFVINTKTKRRIFFDLEQSFERLKNNIKLPSQDEDIRMISPAGGWSSCSLIMLIASYEIIEELAITTLRIGIKEAQALADLYDKGRIKQIKIAMHRLAKANKIYTYDEKTNMIFKGRDIKQIYVNNHSKVILAKTKDNYYVIETSSNLNENPKVEQFIFCNDKEIYNYYIKAFNKLGIF